MRKTDSFKDAHGVEIFTYSWVPKNPHAIIQIAHGLGEHALRYDAFAQYLAGRGFAVYADDHRGHGETGRKFFAGDLQKMGRLGPGGLRAAEDAITQFTQMIKTAHPGLPLIYMGHSWGSLMGQRILNRGTNDYDLLILSGSAYRMPGFMESGDLNKHHKHLGDTGYEWLSRDHDVAKAFAADELCFTADPLKLFGVLDALRLFGKPSKAVAVKPMLIISGSDDPLSPKDSLERLAKAYRAKGLNDVTLKVFAGGRHEMLNETNKDEVYAYIADWVESKFKK